MKFLRIWDWQLGARYYVGQFDRGELSHWVPFVCFMASGLFTAVVIELQVWSDAELFSVEAIAMSLVSVVAFVMGLSYLYAHHTETTSFIEKYFVVLIASLPVIVVYWLLLVSVGTFLIQWVSPTLYAAEVFTWFDVVLLSIGYVINYLKLGTYFN